MAHITGFISFLANTCTACGGTEETQHKLNCPYRPLKIITWIDNRVIDDRVADESVTKMSDNELLSILENIDNPVVAELRSRYELLGNSCKKLVEATEKMTILLDQTLKRIV